MRAFARIVSGAIVATPQLVWADHPGPFRGAPMSPMQTALLWAGFAGIIVVVVFLVVAILTRRPVGPDEEP